MPRSPKGGTRGPRIMGNGLILIIFYLLGVGKMR